MSKIQAETIDHNETLKTTKPKFKLRISMSEFEEANKVKEKNSNITTALYY